MKRLQRELADLRAVEARRLARLKKVQANVAQVEMRITALRESAAPDDGAPGSETSGAGPIGYCMRDKRRVRIIGPRPVTLSNGRAAIAGLCSICGARLTVFTARPRP